FLLGGRERLEVRKVKTQIRRGNNRSGLLHVCSQNLTQRGVHQVCRSVIASRRITLLDVDVSRDRITNLETSFLDFDLMDDQTLRWRVSIENSRQLVRWTNDDANVSDLPATLRIERRVVEHDLAFFTLAQRLDLIAFDNSNNGGISDVRRFITLEERS